MKILSLIEDIPDPRMEGKVVHNLTTILFVSLCGILSGCESWSDICDYCEVKKDWLSDYVDLSNYGDSLLNVPLQEWVSHLRHSHIFLINITVKKRVLQFSIS